VSSFLPLRSTSPFRTQSTSDLQTMGFAAFLAIEKNSASGKKEMTSELNDLTYVSLEVDSAVTYFIISKGHYATYHHGRLWMLSTDLNFSTFLL
jgi:hypothetical protein